MLHKKMLCYYYWQMFKVNTGQLREAATMMRPVIINASDQETTISESFIYDRFASFLLCVLDGCHLSQGISCLAKQYVDLPVSQHDK